MRVEEGAALIASVLANGNRDRKKHPEPFTVADFMVHVDEQVIDLKDAMEQWA
nr:hypothetical protein [Pseudomonas typographi]